MVEGEGEKRVETGGEEKGGGGGTLQAEILSLALKHLCTGLY